METNNVTISDCSVQERKKAKQTIDVGMRTNSREIGEPTSESGSDDFSSYFKMRRVDWRWAVAKGFYNKETNQWNQKMGGQKEYIRQRNLRVNARRARSQHVQSFRPDDFSPATEVSSNSIHCGTEMISSHPAATFFDEAPLGKPPMFPAMYANPRSEILYPRQDISNVFADWNIASLVRPASNQCVPSSDCVPLYFRNHMGTGNLAFTPHPTSPAPVPKSRFTMGLLNQAAVRQHAQMMLDALTLPPVPHTLFANATIPSFSSATVPQSIRLPALATLGL